MTAGIRTSAMSAGTLKKTAEGLGVRPLRVLERDLTVEHGISAVRQMLPLCEFNEEPIPFDDETPAQAKARMARGLDALKQYRRLWDEKLQRFSDVPLHDWASDFADALRYLARGRRPFPNTNAAPYDFTKSAAAGARTI
jgi:phage terminase large subunit